MVHLECQRMKCNIIRLQYHFSILVRNSPERRIEVECALKVKTCFGCVLWSGRPKYSTAERYMTQMHSRYMNKQCTHLKAAQLAKRLQ